MPAASVALADSVIVPDTVASFAGAVIETDGFEPLPSVVPFAAADIAETFPAAS
jgi:hypothetical protein